MGRIPLTVRTISATNNVTIRKKINSLRFWLFGWSRRLFIACTSQLFWTLTVVPVSHCFSGLLRLFPSSCEQDTKENYPVD
jgi:hypothetical protein